jgi:hypothetical protein
MRKIDSVIVNVVYGQNKIEKGGLSHYDFKPDTAKYD